MDHQPDYVDASEHPDGEPRDPGSDHRSDVELLVALRGGDLACYDELWCRHVGAALQLARRIAPRQAEDLVAESFTAVFHQVVVAGNGPREGFRPYLFTTMRNMAARWYRDEKRFTPLPEADEIEAEESTTQLEDQADLAMVLQAFRALPERWQNILWLAEVEDVPRSVMSDRLDLTPNATSALLVRAKEGLRTQWLREHIPASLYAERAHAAQLLPELVRGRLGATQTAQVLAHVDECEGCAAAYRTLKGLSWQVWNKSLGALGFAALGATLHVTVSVLAPPVAGAAAASSMTALTSGGVGTSTAVGASAGVTASKILALSAGVALTASLIGVSGTMIAETSADEHAGAASGPPRSSVVLADANAGPPAGIAKPDGEDPRDPAVRNDGTDAPPQVAAPDGMPYIDLWGPGSGSGPRVRPAPPERAPGDVPQPGAPGDSGLPAPTVSAMSIAPGYIAPELVGESQPGAMVAVMVGGDTFLAASAAEGGWSFDLSTLGLDLGTHRATVWQYSDDAVSPPAESSFDLRPVAVTGFTDFMRWDAVSAEADGLVFELAGPATGSVCLSADTGQHVEIPLSATGDAARRVRFLAPGAYGLEWAVCAGGREGPPVAGTIEIEAEGGFSPFGDLVEPWILVEEP